MAPTPLVFQELRYQIEELRTQEFTSPHTLHSDAPVLSFRRTTTRDYAWVMRKQEKTWEAKKVVRTTWQVLIVDRCGPCKPMKTLIDRFIGC